MQTTLLPVSLFFLALLLGMSFALFAALERRFPSRPLATERKRRFTLHVALLIFNSALFFIVLGPFRPSQLVRADDSAGSLAFEILTALLALDFVTYVAHCLHHRIPGLWRFHRVHHDDDHVDVSSAFREHFLQTVIAGVGVAMAVLVVRPSATAYFVYVAATHLAQLWQHANIRVPPRLDWVLRSVFVTPSFHLVHHAPLAGPRHGNLGIVFSIWDRIFGTAQADLNCSVAGGGGMDALTMEAVVVRSFRKGSAAASLILLVGFLSACNRSAPQDAWQVETLSPPLVKEIEYGRELFTNTARYLGPKGTVQALTKTRMACQNCHLDGGRKPFGVDLTTTHGRYPDYRAREGKVLTLADRINTCIERPMNGKLLKEDTREMRALLAYFRFLAAGVPTGHRRHGDRLNAVVHFPPLAASPERGEALYQTHCVRCHGAEGAGELDAAKAAYVYPPVWGAESYGRGASLHRNIKLAGFLKANMPLGATWDRPMLSDQEAFDIASFVNDDRHQRPGGIANDYPKLEEKPIDFPYGPYADQLPETLHRLGPFDELARRMKERNVPLNW